MRRFIVLALVFACVGSTHAWRQTIDDSWSVNDQDTAHLVAVDAAGDVFAAGELAPSAAGSEMSVVKLSGADGSLVWRVGIVGTSGGGTAGGLALDAAGDVLVGGSVRNGGAPVFAVVKLDGGTGGEMWRTEIAGTDPMGIGVANAVAVDGAGDVVAAGYISNLGTDSDLVTIKLAGGTGAQLWRTEVAGAGGSTSVDSADAVVVDGAGDVIAAGVLANSGGNFAVLKFAGASGTELWRREIAGTNPGMNAAETVTVDAANDVVAGGRVNNTNAAWDLITVKLAAASGAVLWRTEIDGSGGTVGSPIEEARDVVVDAAGDVIAAGVLNNRNTESDMAIVKLAGATGAELWRTELTGPANGSDDVANAIDLDSTGDVLVAGQTFRGSPDAAFTVAKLRGSTGSEVWRQDFDGTWFDVDARDAGRALAVDGSDDVIAAGALLNDHALADLDFAVLKLSGLDGVSGPVAGRRLQVTDRAGAPTDRRIFTLARDRTIATAPGGSAGDPTLGGGVLRLVNPTTLETAPFTLPAAGWTALGTPPGARGYRYADSAGANGPCRTLLVKAGKIRGVCAGAIPFSLDEPTQGTLVVSLRLGTAAAQCMRFGGTVSRDQGTANPGPSGTFVARNAPVFAGDCP
jgi:hypothetical protein